MSLKIENSRRVAKSRPVYMDLYGCVRPAAFFKFGARCPHSPESFNQHKKHT
jgi:hypothetical protein